MLYLAKRHYTEGKINVEKIWRSSWIKLKIKQWLFQRCHVDLSQTQQHKWGKSNKKLFFSSFKVFEMSHTLETYFTRNGENLSFITFQNKMFFFFRQKCILGKLSCISKPLLFWSDTSKTKLHIWILKYILFYFTSYSSSKSFKFYCHNYFTLLLNKKYF